MTGSAPETEGGHPGRGAGSLRRRVASAAGWVVLGRVASHILRLGSNLVLTRLLFPEAFGLVALVQAFIDGLLMLSDVGVGLSVVQDRRGEERDYLDTAWTIQILRGFALWGVALLLAWPMASLYGEPILGPLLVVAALSLVIQGFASMSLFTLRRRMAVGKLMAIELLAQGVSVVAMIGFVWFYPTVWGLILGRLVAAGVTLLASHRVSESIRHRFRWDRDAARSMYLFGRWIALTTPFAYAMNQGDRLILGGFVPMETLGLYAIGALLVKSVQMVNNQVADRVVFPLYSEVGKRTDAGFRRRVAKLRLALMAAFLPPLWLLVLWGDAVVGLLYDARYEGAGWITQVLAAGAIFTVVGRAGPIHLARGESSVGLVAAAVPALFLVVATATGWVLAGGTGMVVGIAATLVVRYPIEVWISRRYGIWMPLYDLAGFAATAAVLGLGWAVRCG